MILCFAGIFYELEGAQEHTDHENANAVYDWQFHEVGDSVRLAAWAGPGTWTTSACGGQSLARCLKQRGPCRRRLFTGRR
jgi:hypothetical protein